MKNILSENIARFRRSKGYTQEELAGKLNLSPQAVSKWENGISEPTTTNLIALAKLFGVAPEDLLQEVQK